MLNNKNKSWFHLCRTDDWLGAASPSGFIFPWLVEHSGLHCGQWSTCGLRLLVSLLFFPPNIFCCITSKHELKNNINLISKTQPRQTRWNKWSRHQVTIFSYCLHPVIVHQLFIFVHKVPFFENFLFRSGQSVEWGERLLCWRLSCHVIATPSAQCTVGIKDSVNFSLTVFQQMTAVYIMFSLVSK